MSKSKVYPVHSHVLQESMLDEAAYLSLYEASLRNPDQFWSDHGRRLEWIKPYSRIKNTSYAKGDVSINWYQDGVLNVCANCIDRHLPENFNRTAIIFEGDDPKHTKHISYAELHEQVSRLGNVLKELGVTKGDVVTLYMPMIPEAAFAMLACARIGAIHSVVFGGFSPEALAGRISDCRSRFLITADEGVRGGKKIPLKANADAAIERLPRGSVKKSLVVKRTGSDIKWYAERDVWYHDAIENASVDCPPEPMSAEDPLFILYTSGSTGKPKGVLHTSGGYLVYASMTHEFVFDYKRDDIYWCTADVGWITGHSYIVYGPLANCATTLMFEGVPNYPDYSRFWQVVDKHKVTIFYTAPTAIRALMREGDEPLDQTSRSSLRLLGSVGEPINPEAWEWYYHKVGNGKCPIVDTWWQTETGGILISPLPGATALKPGSATRPFFGIRPALLDDEGQILEGPAEGNLVLTDSWPGQMRTVYRDHERFEQTYFARFDGYYFTGDGARRDEDGYYWITGRVDDVLNVSGHRMGTAEIESALVAHADVAEAAVVGCPHEVKGQGIFAYVTVLAGVDESDELERKLREWVREQIGPVATPDHLQWAPALPKTRSGKIMRRILRNIAAGEFEDMGDISTLADPSVVKQLVEVRKYAS